MFRLYKMRSKRGFTLVELIVVIAIISILMLGISTVLTPSLKFFSNSLKWSSDKSASNTLYRLINEKIKYASEIYYYDGYADAGFSLCL